MVIDQSSFHQTSWNHFCQSETVQFSAIPLKSFNGTKISYWVSIQLVAILNSVFFRPIVSMRVWFGIFNWSLSGSCTAVCHKNESLLSLSFLHPIHLRPFIFLHPIFPTAGFPSCFSSNEFWSSSPGLYLVLSGNAVLGKVKIFNPGSQLGNLN